MGYKPARVLIPRNASDLLSLAETIYAKHQADAATSPLNALQDTNWADNGDKIAAARALDDKAKQLEKDLEKLFQQRDLLLAPVSETVKASRDLLLGTFSKSPKSLGDWGFTVDDSPKSKSGNGAKPA